MLFTEYETWTWEPFDPLHCWDCTSLLHWDQFIPYSIQHDDNEWDGGVAASGASTGWSAVNANNNGTSTGSMFVRMLCKHPHSLIFGNNNNHTHMDKLEHCPMNDLAAGNWESKRTQKHLSNESHIVLNSVQSQSMGKYSCEVSADAPSFHTLYDSVDLKVVGKLFCFLQALQTLECLMPFPWRDLIVTIRRGGTATAGKEMTIKGIH